MHSTYSGSNQVLACNVKNNTLYERARSKLGLAISKQKPCDRTCGYWILDNHNGAQKNGEFQFYCKMFFFFNLNASQRTALGTTLRCHEWEGQDGNGSGHGKLSLVPSCRRRQNTFFVQDSDVNYPTYINAFHKTTGILHRWQKSYPTKLKRSWTDYPEMQ